MVERRLLRYTCFFCKKKMYEEMRLREPHFLINPQGSISNVKCFCWPKIDITSLFYSKC